MTGYGLLGATWLVMKTEGSVAERARSQARLLLLAVLAFMVVVSVWTPLAFERIAARWFSFPEHPVLLVGAGRDGARRIRRVALARERRHGASRSSRRSRCSCLAISGS